MPSIFSELGDYSQSKPTAKPKIAADRLCEARGPRPATGSPRGSKSGAKECHMGSVEGEGGLEVGQVERRQYLRF